MSESLTSPARPVPESADEARTPYQLPQCPDLVGDVVLARALDAPEEVWVPQSEWVSFRPLLMNVSQGYYVNLLRVRRSGVLSRHRHSGPVHAYVLRGRWQYLEHDWVADEGSYAFEAPGETHTLVVPDGVDEMVTMFHVTGGLVYVDPYGKPTGYEDVHTKIALARAHYADTALGAEFIEQFIK